MSVLVFSTPFCAKCPSVKKKLEAAGIKYEDINAIKYPQLVKEYNVQSVPTVILNHSDSFETFTGDAIEEFIAGRL